MRRIYWVIGILFSWGYVHAQNNENSKIETQEIIILKDFQATIEEAEKIKFTPLIPDNIELKKEKLSYQLPEKIKSFAYEPKKLQAAPYQMVDSLERFNGFVKLGLSYPVGTFLEAGYTKTISKNIEVGGYAKHQAVWSAPVSYQKYMQNTASVFSTIYAGKFVLKPSITYTQRTNYFYGTVDSTVGINPLSASTSRNIQQVKSALYLENRALPKGLEYTQQLDAGYTFDNFKYNEYTYNGTSTVSKSWNNKHFLTGEFRFDVTQANTYTKTHRTIFSLQPMYMFKNDNWKLIAAIQPALENKTLHLLPKFETYTHLVKYHLIFFSGWNRTIQKNSFTAFTQENPYWLSQDTIMNSRVEDRFAGFKGAIKKVAYELRFTNKVIRNAPLYINDSIKANTYRIIYDNNFNLINLHAGVAYDYSTALKFFMNTDVYLYETSKDIDRAWHKPALDFTFRTQYHWNKKLLVSGEVLAYYGAYTQLRNGNAKLLPTGVDINLSGTYKLKNNFNAFVQLNNLANIKYQRLYGYNTYGINGMLGVQYMFK